MASDTVRKPRREKIGRRLYEVHNLDGSTSYFADLEIEGRQTRRKLAATMRTAAREEQQNLGADNNRNLVAAPTKITLAEVAEEWILGLEVRPRSLDAYRYQLVSNILPTLGAKPVQEIRPRSCNALKTKLREQGLALETRLAALRVLERVLEHAIIEGYIVSNPMERVQKRPQGKQVKEAHRYLSPAEISKLLDYSNGYRAIIEVAAFTGLRQSEALGLVWGDIDLTAGTLTVSAQLSRADKIEDAKRVPTKTGEERTVNIDAGLVTLFKDLKEKAFADGHARPDDFVFRTRNGYPVSYRKVWEVFNTAADKAKLNEAGRRLRFHDLRRTYASILINDGAPITHVAAQLGHTPAILLSTYSGLIKAQEGQHRERQLGAVAAFREGGAL